MDPDSLELRVTQNPDELDKIIEKQTGQKITFSQDSSMGLASKALLRMKYLRYYNKHVMYLPYACPDDGLWSDEAARDFVKTLGIHRSKATAIEAVFSDVSSKVRYAKLSELFQLPIDSVHTMFLNRHIADKPQVWKILVDLVGGFDADH